LYLNNFPVICHSGPIRLECRLGGREAGDWFEIKLKIGLGNRAG
jgi:hypothetical protein